MVDALLLVATVLGFLAIVPAATLAMTRSWSATWDAAKGYGIVMGLLVGLPMLLGLVIAGVGLLMT